MYLFDFKSKLARLNELLYVGESHAVQNSAEWKSAALYLRKAKRDTTFTSTDKNYAGNAAAFVDASMSGQLHEHICGVPLSFVPEFDVFDENGKVLARGWRSILYTLLQKKLISTEGTERVFNWTPSEYDRLSYENKLAWARGERFGKPASKKPSPLRPW